MSVTAQLSWLPEPPPAKPMPPPKAKRVKPTPDPDRAALWGAGRYNLESLLGIGDTAARRLLGRLERGAHHNRAALVELIERCVQERPDEPVSWLMAGAKKIAGEDADLWGLQRWHAAAPAEVREWPIEDFEAIMSVSGLPASWRGGLGTLTAWIVDGYRPDSVFDVVAGVTASFSGEIHSLRFFDTRVRTKAVRWDPDRAEWRAG